MIHFSKEYVDILKTTGVMGHKGTQIKGAHMSVSWWNKKISIITPFFMEYVHF